MNRTEIVQSLRAEIAQMQKVLDLLSDLPNDLASQSPGVRRGPGRPKGSVNRPARSRSKELTPKRRTMSAEGKARIAAAQKKRWAIQKKAAASKPRVVQPAASKQAGKAASKGAKKSVNTAKKAAQSPAPK